MHAKMKCLVQSFSTYYRRGGAVFSYCVHGHFLYENTGKCGVRTGLGKAHTYLVLP